MIPSFQPGTMPSASQLTALARACNGYLGMRGDGIIQVTHMGDQATIALNFGMLRERLGWVQQGPVPFFAKLGTAVAYSGKPNAWKYPWTEQVQASAGYGHWGDLSGGRSDLSMDFAALNLMEDMNSGSGMLGIGIQVSDLSGTGFSSTVQPVPAGEIVVMYATFSADKTPAYWFSATNGVLGTCT
jgi:hypothetical protein